MRSYGPTCRHGPPAWLLKAWGRDAPGCCVPRPMPVSSPPISRCIWPEAWRCPWRPMFLTASRRRRTAWSRMRIYLRVRPTFCLPREPPGGAKASCWSHTALAANAENLAEAQGFSPALTFVISGPLNHIGSLSKVWPVILTGGTLHLTEGLKEMDVFLSAFSRPAGRYATFLVPAALRMLMALGGDRLSALSGRMAFIETGAAPMAQADMERLCRLFPHSRLFNTYASTETGIVCTHDFNTPGGCVAGCLGRPMKHARVFITPDHTVACQGPMLMSGYVNALDAAAGILRDGTLFTHDLGRLDEAQMQRVDNAIAVSFGLHNDRLV